MLEPHNQNDILVLCVQVSVAFLHIIVHEPTNNFCVLGDGVIKKVCALFEIGAIGSDMQQATLLARERQYTL
jgi:hypothetical protein